jgi:DNA-3-methyladenine glycosylase
MPSRSGTSRSRVRTSRREARAVGRDARPLGRAFYARPSVIVARAVLGRVLVFDAPSGRLAGRIVEVEAYGGANDPASHAHRGRTERNAVMFGEPGHAYVYFTYGMHFCMNLVTAAVGRPSAVLLRALEPLEGLDFMRKRRGPVREEALARGPGNLARAFGLNRSHDGADLVRGPIWVSREPARRGGLRVATLPRVGIRLARSRRWRFALAGHPSVSGPAVTGRGYEGRRPRARRARPQLVSAPRSERRR